MHASAASCGQASMYMDGAAEHILLRVGLICAIYYQDHPIVAVVKSFAVALSVVETLHIVAWFKRRYLYTKQSVMTGSLASLSVTFVHEQYGSSTE